jgi:hypothetical protein
MWPSVQTSAQSPMIRHDYQRVELQIPARCAAYLLLSVSVTSAVSASAMVSLGNRYRLMLL